MSVYGQTAYDAGVYGNAAAGLSSVPFTADPAPGAYTGIQLNWSSPGGTWDRLRVVRNRFGFPITADDGLALVDSWASETYGSGTYGDGVYGGFITVPTQYLDTSNLLPSTFYYYALYVRQVAGAALTWTRVAVAIGQSVGDHKYKDWMLDRIPSIFTTSGGSEADGPEPGSVISRFLNVFGSDANRIRDYLDHLNHVQDPDTVHGDLLVALCQNWGYTYEPAIGMKQNRVIAKNASYLRQTKGTSPGVQALARAVTGWGAKQLRLTNLMLDNNDASFEQSTGNWRVVTGQATLSQNTTLSFSNGSNSATACLQVTCTNAGAVSLAVAGDYTYGNGTYGQGAFSTQSPTRFGIPVTGAEQYIVSAYCRSAATSRSPILDIQWYDGTGTLLSTTSGSAGSATTTTDWSCRISTIANAPIAAVYAVPVLKYTTMALNEIQYVDAVQFEHPRNYFTAADCNFTSLTGDWAAVGTPTLSTFATPPAPGFNNSLKVTLPTDAGSLSQGVIYTATLLPGRTYTFSAYINIGTATSLASVEFEVSGGGGFTPITAIASQTLYDQSYWVRQSVTFSTPATGASQAISFSILNGSGCTSGDYFYVGAPQLELASAATTAALPALSAFADARQIRLQMIAPRVNEIRNPGFDTGVGQWFATFASTSLETVNTYNGGLGSMHVTPFGNNNSVWTNPDVDPNQPYQFSCQVQTVSAAQMQLLVQFLDQTGQVIAQINGSTVNTVAGAWTQFTMSGTTPATAVGAQIYIRQPSGSVQFYVDDAQFEMSPTLLPYFDTRLNSGDVKWEGTAYASRLHYYPNFGPADARLDALVSKHIPLGASKVLLFAQPRGTV